MNVAERIEAVENALCRIHCLSSAIDFMVTADSERRGSTFCASIEEVNRCAHDALNVALDHIAKLGRELREGGAQ